MNTNRRKNVRINAVLWLKIPVYIFGNDNPQRSSNKKKGGVGVNKNVFFCKWKYARSEFRFFSIVIISEIKPINGGEKSSSMFI